MEDIMKIYDFTTYQTVKFIGDIHGGFETMTWDILTRQELSHTLIIVCGDIGMGFNKDEYYNALFEKLNKKLRKAGNLVAMFRGNHDNPVYFNQPELTQVNKFSNIKLIPDYSILRTVEGHILCIGGARSVDKYMRLTDKSWWADEMVTEMPEDFLTELQSNEILVDIVCTHTSPNIAFPIDDPDKPAEIIVNFSFYDKELIEDNKNERERLTQIWRTLKENGHPIHHWMYGHFHECFRKELEGTQFIGLDMLRDRFPAPDGRKYCDWYKINDELLNIN